ncbi:MAG TPA: hypothetical protein VGJ75_19080, partial [Dongiaceae bacterium]
MTNGKSSNRPSVLELLRRLGIVAEQEAGMHTEINIFDKPIERIRKTCQLMGLGADFDRKLPELETHLEELVA